MVGATPCGPRSRSRTPSACSSSAMVLERTGWEVDRWRAAFAMLPETDSRGGSTFVHDQLREGDVLESSAPMNNFPLNEAGERHILIAGGIGITPLMSMSRRLAARGAEFTLHYCARSRAEA